MVNSDMKKIQHSDKQNGACKTGQVSTFDTQQLFGNTREVRLRHCSEEYRLILTKNNKLILTK